ncbi:MAG: T9SS type A sorting domain-containing protein [Bacteroidetes bacterium]|nr:T9SS type A sorting domain-containing protein [Bacteroidota bacterium]
MKRLITIYPILILLGCQNLFSQVFFLGFDQIQCGLITNHDYTYDNSLTCPHGTGYRIYKNGIQVFEKCIEYGGCSVLDMMIISETTGFIIESNSNGHTIYKTVNSGVNWEPIGGGAPTFLGFYLVNQNTGYLVTTWDNPLALYISRVSDINTIFITDSNINNDIIISDTIYGDPFCEMDTLSFKIKNNFDTISYYILLNVVPLNIQDISIKSKASIYPNPVNDYFTFKNIEFMQSDNCITIYNYDGSFVKVLESSKKKNFYVGDLNTGIYLIEISNKQNKAIIKMIKN